ncbi:MAG: EF-P beta-lysylation protein EpmB [Ectothiorhodospiraceae bacterium]|nr:EF-P beta-lysylation protein EpmB [Ectothiorhodospiraceae bacterium]
MNQYSSYPYSSHPCSSHQYSENSLWQAELASAIKDPAELLKEVRLSPSDIPGGVDLDQPFPQRVPRSYVAQIQPGDPDDPLLLQVLPQSIESSFQTGFLQDPVGDKDAAASPGLLHKYHGRVLLITTGACPVHCRYCFRRHFPYAENRPESRDWGAAIEYIASNPDINEVILSGGDPLSLSTGRLQDISCALRDIPHLKRLRIHTRMPIVLPARIDTDFLHWLSSLPWQLVMVTHCNHANELGPEVKNALAALRATGITLLNQTVLLKSVNDNANTLSDLSESLFAAGVLPYYLHLLDRVQGAAHFEVDEITACNIMHKLRAQLSGYLVPQLVRETAGKPYKIPVTTAR